MGRLNLNSSQNIINSLFNFAQALDESDAIADEIRSLIDIPLCNDSTKIRVADIACSLALEHWHATRLLLRGGLLPSALVAHRSQFEALLRSVWLTYAASDKDIEKLNANLDLDSEQAAKNIMQTQDMLEALAKSGPKEAYDALARFKDNSWKALNSYAHAGIHPIRRHSEGYPTALAHGVLCNANGLAIVSGMQAAALSGAQPLQRKLLDLAARHPSCMPQPL